MNITTHTRPIRHLLSKSTEQLQYNCFFFNIHTINSRSNTLPHLLINLSILTRLQNLFLIFFSNFDLFKRHLLTLNTNRLHCFIKRSKPKRTPPSLHRMKNTIHNNSITWRNLSDKIILKKHTNSLRLRTTTKTLRVLLNLNLLRINKT